MSKTFFIKVTKKVRISIGTPSALAGKYVSSHYLPFQIPNSTSESKLAIFFSKVRQCMAVLLTQKRQEREFPPLAFVLPWLHLCNVYNWSGENAKSSSRTTMIRSNAYKLRTLSPSVLSLNFFHSHGSWQCKASWLMFPPTEISIWTNYRASWIMQAYLSCNGSPKMLNPTWVPYVWYVNICETDNPAEIIVAIIEVNVALLLRLLS